MKGKPEKMTIESFSEDEYADQLREQGYKDEVIPDMVAKKKDQLEGATKSESTYRYVRKVEINLSMLKCALKTNH